MDLCTPERLRIHLLGRMPQQLQSVSGGLEHFSGLQSMLEAEEDGFLYLWRNAAAEAATAQMHMPVRNEGRPAKATLFLLISRYISSTAGQRHPFWGSAFSLI